MEKHNKFILIIAALAEVALEMFLSAELKATEAGNVIYEIMIRAIGIAAFTALISELGYLKLFSVRWSVKPRDIIFLLVCFVIAINNFPFAALIGGNVTLSLEWDKVLNFAVICIFVGGYEEISFRGFLLPLFLERMKKNRWGAFWAIAFSSMIFGAVHIVNIFAGADPVAVLLQIGYAALIGGLTSVVLLKTRNLWYCILLHSLYNFNGGLTDRFGSGEIWTPPQIALTATVAVLVTAYVIWQFCLLSDEDIQAVLERKKEKKC